MAEPIKMFCAHCREWQLLVAFERVEALWPDTDVCGPCFSAWSDEQHEELRFDLVHGGACACTECV